MVKIGFETSAKGGPGIFLNRLRAEMESLGAFSTSGADVWLQLSHKPLSPDRPSGSKLMMRTAGGYYYRHYLLKKPALLPLPWPLHWIDSRISQRRNDRLNALIRENLALADGIVFQTEFTRRMVQHFVLQTPPGEIILNGVDVQHFSPPAESDRVGKKGLDILVSHQFRPHKRLHDVVRLVARLRLALPQSQPITLHVLGGDSRNAFAQAKTVIDREGMEDVVKFWGLQPPESLPDFYRRCDLMIALPLWDPCPNTVVEAVSCGLPVITTSAGGIPEIIGPAGRVIQEDLPLVYTDHHHKGRIPAVDINAALHETLILLERLSDYRALARERALERLDIRLTARNYLAYAERLLAGKG